MSNTKITKEDRLALLICQAANEFCQDCCIVGAGNCSQVKDIAKYLLENGVDIKC